MDSASEILCIIEALYTMESSSVGRVAIERKLYMSSVVRIRPFHPLLKLYTFMSVFVRR